MKATINFKGQFEFDFDKDLPAILKEYFSVPDNRRELSLILNSYLMRVKGYMPKKIQYPKEGVDKIVAIVDTQIDEGAKPLGVHKNGVEKVASTGFSRKWLGLYGAVGDILDSQRKRKKKFISFDDLLAELHGFEDEKGKKMFVKDGEELPMYVLKQRCAPSQIPRQAKGQPNLRGVVVDKKQGGLKFG